MLTLQLALRFLFSRKREKFISINAFLAVGSVALSVLVLIVVIGVMSGFDLSLREKIMTMTPHLLVQGDGPVENWQGIVDFIKKDSDVTAAAPFITGNAMMEAEGKVYGVSLMGLSDPEGYQVIRLAQYLKSGEMHLKRNEVLLGTELAKETGVRLGGIIKIQSPAGVFNEDFPPELLFTVKGFYESGLYDYDSRQIFIPLEDAELLFGFKDKVHGVGASVKTPDNAGSVKARIVKSLPDGLNLRTWIENNKNFFAALRTEKNVMFILLTFAILIASLNIISTLVMLVMEKFRDIGILKAIGFSRRLLLSIFLLKGFIIGVLGTLIGTTVGILFLHHIDSIQDFVASYTGYEVFPADVYYFDKIPTRLTPEDLTLILCLALGTAILASIYPAYKAANLEAMEALRHE